MSTYIVSTFWGAFTIHELLLATHQAPPAAPRFTHQIKGHIFLSLGAHGIVVPTMTFMAVIEWLLRRSNYQMRKATRAIHGLFKLPDGEFLSVDQQWVSFPTQRLYVQVVWSSSGGFMPWFKNVVTTQIGCLCRPAQRATQSSVVCSTFRHIGLG